MRSPASLTLGALVLTSTLVALGCDRRTEAFPDTPVAPPAEPVRIPTLSSVDPATLPAPLGLGANGAAAPGAGGPNRAGGSEADGPPIRGVIRLAEGALEPSQGLVFVILRKPGMRPPMAAVRLPPGPFPLEFEIGADDRAQMGGVQIPFTAPMELTARTDLDGDPMSRSPGELEGSAGGVEPGDSVEIVLDAP